MNFIKKFFSAKKNNCKTTENGLLTEEERIRLQIIKIEISLRKEKNNLKEFLKKHKK